MTCVKPKAALYMFPKLDPKMYPIEDDQQFAYELLPRRTVLLVQGTGFNWPTPDHFRVVFLPNVDDLREAIGRIAQLPRRAIASATRAEPVDSDSRHETHQSRPAGHRHRRQRHLHGTAAQPGRDQAPRRPRHRDHAWSPTSTPRARRRVVGARRRRWSTTARAVDRRSRHRHRRRADRRLRHRAASWCCEAIAAGKHVVTANKALLAVHGTEIFAAAREKGVMVAFEAAVAGGIPIIKALREGLTANRIEWIAGIINGTTNFILSEMRDKGLDFDDRAQGGAAPRLRRGRSDLRHRRRRRRAQGDDHERDRVRHAGAVRQGATSKASRKLQAADISYAEQLGYRIKLLGITKRTDARASSCACTRRWSRRKRLIANVEGAMNAVVVQGDAVGTTLYYGKGAGAEPTAIAVIADLVDITRLHTADPEHRVPHLAFQPDQLCEHADPADRRGRHRVLPAPARRRPGRRAGRRHAASWPTRGISIDAMLQTAEPVDGTARTQTDLIILTHDTRREER